MKTLVIGLGVSGRAAVQLLLSQGRDVVAIDRNKQVIEGVDVFLDEPGFSLDGVDQVILSSGVRPTHPLCVRAREHGIEVVGEAAFAMRFAKQPCVAITGTNGKTTVTLLVEHLLKSCGIKARALGNVGEPLASYFMAPDPEEVLVVELSSYQLETFSTPVFDAGVILNITPDHLDQYASFEEYAAAKCLLQKAARVLYVHPRLASLLPQAYVFESAETHDGENANAAWELVRFFMSREQFLQGLSTFKKPPHRIEFVKEVLGVAYVDDSKGTNVDAVIQAVKSIQGPIILIAGGVDKGSSYASWIPAFQGKIKQIFALGEAAYKIANELSIVYKVEIVFSLEEAVKRAAGVAKRGDTVLLSPGCASFDMFRDYAQRGEVFKQQVGSIGDRYES